MIGFLAGTETSPVSITVSDVFEARN